MKVLLEKGEENSETNTILEHQSRYLISYLYVGNFDNNAGKCNNYGSNSIGNKPLIELTSHFLLRNLMARN